MSRTPLRLAFCLALDGIASGALCRTAPAKFIVVDKAENQHCPCCD